MTKSDNISEWALKPKVGLGDISFGMSRDTVDALTVYGAVTGSRDSNPIPDDEATDFLKTLGIGDSDIAGALGRQAELARPGIVTETRAGGLVLEYDRSGLVEILADVKADMLNYNGRFIFREPPTDIIKYLSLSLGEHPVIFENEIAFPDNYIFLFEFLKAPKVREGDSSSYSEGSRNDRSIIWRSKPRDMGEDLSKYAPFDI